MNEHEANWRSRLSSELNFAITNCLPRRTVSRFMGRFSQIRHPLVRDLSIAVWRRFSDLDLSDARKTRFDSLHDCFIRELAPGSRPIDSRPEVLISPCDSIVGACGSLTGVTALQAKGHEYPLSDLLRDQALAEQHRDGCYATLRLTATMYHRFHAPTAGCVEHVTYVPGDAWNVNGPAVRRVDRLYCRNERAIIRTRSWPDGQRITLVPIAAILVGSLRLHVLRDLLDSAYQGPREIPCQASIGKGDELGWFQHGSTIIMLAPHGFRLADDIRPGRRLRMGQPLMAMT